MRDDGDRQPPPPEVTVIIPVLNGAWCIGQQLAALSRQTTQRPFEVLVCDNGSSDSTREVVDMWQARVVGLRVVDASDRRSAAHARNVGIANAKGGTLLFCDADDVVSDDWVETFAAHVREGSMANGWTEYALLNPADTYAGDGMSDDLIMRCGFLPGIESGNLGIATVDARTIGGFDESYPHAEDIDFGWRAQVAGIALASVPAILHCRVRGGLWALFKQHRLWSISSIMMRRRWEASIPPSYSLKFSLVEVLRQSVLLLPSLIRTSGFDRREVVRRFGTAVGEVVGLMRYRVWGSPPAAELLDFGVTGEAPAQRPAR